jgi:predicted Zn-ribbon and HTH transcriptional regulator
MADRLREETLAASALASEFEVKTGIALDHVEHIARSLDGTGEQLLAVPPECRECGFDEFDDVANRPSRCPECKSESVEEPAFRID